MSDTKIREEFEKWCCDGGVRSAAIARDSDGDYMLTSSHNAWLAWQAAVEAERERCANKVRKAMPNPVCSDEEAHTVDALCALLEAIKAGEA